jgi:hypothetical protein
MCTQHGIVVGIHATNEIEKYQNHISVLNVLIPLLHFATDVAKCNRGIGVQFYVNWFLVLSTLYLPHIKRYQNHISVLNVLIPLLHVAKAAKQERRCF